MGCSRAGAQSRGHRLVCRTRSTVIVDASDSGGVEALPSAQIVKRANTPTLELTVGLGNAATYSLYICARSMVVHRINEWNKEGSQIGNPLRVNLQQIEI
jgi:hypothetical protein